MAFCITSPISAPAMIVSTTLLYPSIMRASRIVVIKLRSLHYSPLEEFTPTIQATLRRAVETSAGPLGYTATRNTPIRTRSRS